MPSSALVGNMIVVYLKNKSIDYQNSLSMNIAEHEEFPDKNCLRFMALHDLKNLDEFYKTNSIEIVFD